jgi:acyl-CoA synthetase (AMP-forming)/AMP-acid ligase II
MTNQDTLVAVLQEHAYRQGDRLALTFVADLAQHPTGESLSYHDLDLLARRTAGLLQDRYAVGDRAMLLFPAGLQFAVTMLGCMYAGLIAVPVPMPDRSAESRRRCAGVVHHAGVRVVLTEEASLPAVTGWRDAEGLGQLECVAVDRAGPADPDAWVRPDIGPDTVTMLQYTSGSTSEPKGVIITHDTILTQVAMSRRMMGVGRDSRFGGWLPMHHDLGLLGQLLQPVALGAVSVLMPPFEFLKRPVRWLELIDQHWLEVSLAPNFAYQMCVAKVTDEQVAQLDLSGWQVAGNGAEAVQASTLEAFTRRFAPAGFRAEAFTVGYGLAEAMAYTSVGPRSEPPFVCRVDAARLEHDEFVPADGSAEVVSRVSCGRPCEVEIRIVDPRTATPLPDGRVGEIWLRGRAVAPGYWAADEATRAAFGAATATGENGYLRTGDLGTLYSGELFVTGRLKDMLVVRGRNLYPQDIEHEVSSWHDALRTGVGAVFAVPSANGADNAEELVLVHECQGTLPEMDGPVTLAATIRDRMARQFGIHVGGVVLVRPGGVARTTSGKVRRSAMRQLFVDRRLTPLCEDLSPRLRVTYHGERAVLDVH